MGARRHFDGVAKRARPHPFWVERHLRREDRRPLIAVLLIALIASLVLVGLRDAIALALIIRSLNGHYLVLFQNDAELRASGGFIGSFAKVDFEKGIPKKIAFDANPYRRDNSFVRHLCLEPPWFIKHSGIERCLSFHDGNFLASFPESARLLLFLDELEGGGGASGVIALNAALLGEALKATSGVTLADGTVVTAENFRSVLQWKVEREYFREGGEQARLINEPKSVLAEVGQILRARMREPIPALRFAAAIRRAARERQLLFYSTDPRLERRILAAGLAGTLEEASLYLKDLNLGGGKSSVFIHQTLSARRDGELLHLALRRAHNGKGVWPDAENRALLRFFAPVAAKFTQATVDGRAVEEVIRGFEAGRRTVSLFLATPPGKTRFISIRLHLPGKESLALLRQPGATPMVIGGGRPYLLTSKARLVP